MNHEPQEIPGTNGFSIGTDHMLRVHVGGTTVTFELSVQELRSMAQALTMAAENLEAMEADADDMLAQAFRNGGAGHA
ncbi:MAG: hypothetical protein KDE63_09375 [Novosphingobium sp.]|nr:hypothetical protein [Novosphingobium sp.]